MAPKAKRQSKKRHNEPHKMRVPTRPIKVPPKYNTPRLLTFFGEVIQTRRWETGLSRWTLGALCGKGYGFIHRIETGQRVTLPRVREFYRLSAALDLLPSELLEAAGYDGYDVSEDDLKA